MNPEPLASATDPDLVNSLTALRRAGRMAREVAVRTDTHIVIARDGKLIEVTAEELQRMGIR